MLRKSLNLQCIRCLSTLKCYISNSKQHFFINVFMTAVFSALAYWWISRFEKRQARKLAAGGKAGDDALARQI